MIVAFILSFIIATILQDCGNEAWPAEIFPDKSSLAEKLKQRGFSQKKINEFLNDKRLCVNLDIFLEVPESPSMFSEESILRGKQCLLQHRTVFEGAQEMSGVDKEILLGIYRIETDLGRKAEKFPVASTLYTHWATKYRRSEYFGREFLEWFVVCDKYGFNPYALGSSAGAFGLLQTMPSNFLRFAKDGDGDGKVNPSNLADALFTAANHLKNHGWQRGEPERNIDVLRKYNPPLWYRNAVYKYASKIKNLFALKR